MTQDACYMIGLTPPASIINNNNLLAKELLACAQEEGFDLMRRATWQTLTRQQLWPALAQEEQTGMIPADLDRFINDTFWNRTRKRMLFGPTTPQEWQNLKAWTSSPVVDTFRMRDNDILVIPNPTVDDIFAYEYITKNWCTSAALVPQSQWLADTDIGVLDERIMSNGLVWRYKAKKGLDGWQTDKSKYDENVTQAMVQDKPQRTINFGYDNYLGRRPGIVVPQGSWMRP